MGGILPSGRADEFWGWTRAHIAVVSVPLMMGWVIAGCSPRAISEPAQVAAPAPTTPIAQLSTKPSGTAIVSVKGTAGNPVPLLEGTVYPLQDATGNVWILTVRPAPPPGTEVTVKGLIRYKPISINGKEQGSIYIEQQ